MARPKIKRNIQFSPNVHYFKPRGIPLRELDEVQLISEEVESVKLYLVDNLDQTNAANKMGVSQPTFARIYNSACKKIGEALIHGKAIRFEGDPEKDYEGKRNN